MTYFIAKHLENTSNSYAIFTNSYQWSDWQPTLAEAFSAIHYYPSTHSQYELVDSPSDYLNTGYIHFIELPTLPTYPEFISQHPEFFT